MCTTPYRLLEIRWTLRQWLRKFMKVRETIAVLEKKRGDLKDKVRKSEERIEKKFDTVAEEAAHKRGKRSGV